MVFIVLSIAVIALVVGTSWVGVAAEDMGLCEGGNVEQFSDVREGDYGAAYILCMRALGLSVGRGDGSYGPELELTRAQMASFLVRLWRDVLGNQCPGAVNVPFTDVTADGPHSENIVCIYALGVTKGKTATTYGSQDRLTTQQLSRFLLRVYKKVGGVCEPADTELVEAVACLALLRVVPSVAEARQTMTVSRAQMAVYLIGMWRNVVPRVPPPVPPRRPSPTMWKGIAAGEYHSCGIRTDGRVLCWGWNGSGQTDSPPGEFVAVSAGFDHSCGIRADGSGVCWGGGEDTQAAPAGSYTQITLSSDYACGLKKDGTVVCWVLDDPATAEEAAGPWTWVASGGNYSCGIVAGGSVTCGGHDDYGQGDIPDHSFTALDVYWHVCGVTTDGSVVCWGISESAVLEVPAGTYVSVASGGGHSCAITADGEAVCWGVDEHGQATVPDGRYQAIAAGKAHTCAIRTDGTTLCWGLDYEGLLDVP